MKKFIFAIICSLSVIFGISNVNAYTRPTYYLQDSDYSSLIAFYPNYAYAVYYNIVNDNYYAFVSATTNSFYNYKNSNISLGTYDNSTFNYFSNYNKTRYAYQFNINNSTNSMSYDTLVLDKSTHTWTQTWRVDYNLDMNSNYYFVAFLLGENLSYLNNSAVFVDNDSTTILYTPGWNISYYDSVVNYFDISGSFSYLTTPDDVYGSYTNFSSDDYQLSISSDTKLYLNHHMYYSDDLNSQSTMIGTRFHYDNYGSFYDNNYKLGFILTYKYLLVDNTVTILVNAKTKTGSYSCSIQPLLQQDYNSNDIVYQSYVECPSVVFTSDNDDYLDILVKGSYDFSLYNIYPSYFTNYLFLEDKANVGISQILKSVTSTEPEPLPDEGGNDDPEQVPDVNDLISDINSSINSGALPDNLEDLVDFAGYLPPGPVDSILNMPLTFMNSYYSAFTSSSCNGIVVPFPYIDNKYFTLPCGNTLINNMGLINWWEGIGALFGGYCLFKYLVNLYKWVDATLTFRENNFPDWGGN